jgi:hypothetical protein
VPGKLNWAGVTGALDFLFAGFLKRQNLRMTKVPYRNPVEAANDLAEGRVQMYMAALAIVRPQLQTGKIKLLAVTNSVCLEGERSCLGVFGYMLASAVVADGVKSGGVATGMRHAACVDDQLMSQRTIG